MNCSPARAVAHGFATRTLDRHRPRDARARASDTNTEPGRDRLEPSSARPRVLAAWDAAGEASGSEAAGDLVGHLRQR